MTIDIRANVTCSLGDLISGSISDGYIQGGLVFISGNCEIRGLITPAMGQVVTFAYERDGVTTAIPRQLRVLGSFADPFRNTTRVELGCTLTYLKDARPLPEDAETEDPDEKVQSRTPEEYNCRFPDADYPTTPGLNGQPAVPGFINASAVLSECCTRLGIAHTGTLTAKYYVEEFDYSSGYVNVISQLLDTESKFGFINASGALQIRSLSAGGGTGPALTSDNIIDIAPVGIGEIVPGKVVVRFNSLVLKELPEDALTPEDDAPTDENGEEQVAQVYDNWEKVSTIGKPTTITIYYKDPFWGTDESESATYIPYSETITPYGSGSGARPKFNQETCEWETTPVGPDLSNSVIRRESKTKRILAEANGNYCSEVLSTLVVYYFRGAIFPPGQEPAGYGQNRQPPLTKQGETRVVETFEYDNEGNVVKQITESYESYFVFLGRLDIPYIFYGLENGRTTIDQLSIDGPEVLVQRTITTVENIYLENSMLEASRYTYYYGPIKPTDAASRTPMGQRIKTETWINKAISQNGQQAIATFKKNRAFKDAATTRRRLAEIGQGLVLEDQQVEVTRNRQLVPTPGRPTQQELASAQEKATSINSEDDTTPAADQSGRIENTAQFEVVHSGNANLNVLDTSLPLSPDDVYGANGQVINGQGASFARQYGRNQLRLIWGRRYGLNVQLHPDKMPAYPYSPLYISANGVMVQYRANGTNWAFSSDGVAASTDGLFMGVVGGAGTAWVPVAPGVTTFPPAPEPTGSGEVDPSAPIPPYSEMVYVATGPKIGVAVESVPYTLEPIITEATAGLRLGSFISPDVQVFAEGGCALGAAATGSIATVQTTTLATTLGLSVQAQRGPIQTVRPGIKIGVRAGLDPEYEYVQALLRMNGQDQFQTFIDESPYQRSVNVFNNVRTVTGIKKYGSTSAYFWPSNGTAALQINDGTDFVFGLSNFTVEMWVYIPAGNMRGLDSDNFPTLVACGSVFDGAWSMYFIEGPYSVYEPLLAVSWAYNNSGTVEYGGEYCDFSDFAENTWHHIAWTRSGTTGRLFVNGVAQTGLLANATTHDIGYGSIVAVETTPSLTVGGARDYAADTTLAGPLWAHIDDLRITRGVARYTSNFTPPGAEFPAS